MRRLVVLVLVSLAAGTSGVSSTAGAAGPGGSAASPPAGLVAGVSAQLATARRRVVSDVRYQLQLFVPADAAARVTGTNVISFSLATAAEPLVIDFAAGPGAVRAASVNGALVSPREQHGHLVFDPDTLREGANTIAIDFVAGDGPLNRGDDLLYTLFVPARAHRALPCFDQPDLKARLTLTLELPESWLAVANAPEVSSEVRDGRRLVRFAQTPPLSTYLMAFAAGRLVVEEAEREGRRFRLFHRETDAKRVARNREAIFDLHALAIAWLERYTALEYPWQKFDVFLVPAFQFSGMEHPGAIYYNAPALMLDESATQAQLLGRASLIAHETAHMWFGDLVTMRWFDDVWMKEVFANFLAAKIVNPAFPQIDHDLRFLFAHYPGAYDVDRTAGTHPIRQPLDNLEDAGTLYGPIIYLKAPVVMRQLERLLGEDGLRDGLREYLQAHAFDNASWPDLIARLDGRTPLDLRRWSHAWVDEAGRPTIRVGLVADAGGALQALEVTQTDPSGRGRLWPQAIELAIGADGSLLHVPLMLEAARVEVPAADLPPKPRFVLPAGGGLAYGDMPLDAAMQTALMEAVPAIPSAVTRGAALVTLWEQVLRGVLPAAEWVAFAERVLAAERDEQIIARTLAYTQTAFWRFLAPEVRDRAAARLESLLRDGLARAESRTEKAAWFQGLVRLARTPQTVAWLQRVWERREPVEGLPLAELDEITLALELAVREVPDWRAILEQQSRRIGNPDRRARFGFVRPAVDADADVRRRFFERLSDPANRRREPWVLEGLTYLHHPLRAVASEPLVAPALDLLEEIQRTGDIFFPKRWLDATLGGHRSPAVAGTVRAFLDRRPDLAPRLRRLVEQSADELFRAAQQTAAGPRSGA